MMMKVLLAHQTLGVENRSKGEGAKTKQTQKTNKKSQNNEITNKHRYIKINEFFKNNN